MQNEFRTCRCSRRGRICVCVPRRNVDPELIQVMNESRRLRVMDALRAVLERDLMGVDAKWVLFSMAIQSYRYEELVVPFPPPYATASGLNIDSLSFVAGTMTELMTFQRRLLQNLLPPEQVELMHWLLVQSGTPELRQVLRNDQPELWRQLDFKPNPRPHLVFRVVPKHKQSEPIEPLDLANCLYYCGDMDELYALMSAKNYDLGRSQLEFYDDLHVACNMAEWCPGWGYSICGTLLRCVAVCQLHPQKQLEVRYLLIYSMSYTPQMQALRRRQWKKIHLQQRVNQQLDDEQVYYEPQQRQRQPQQQQQQQQQQQPQQQQQARNRNRFRDRERMELLIDYEDGQQLDRPSQTTLFNRLFSRRNAIMVLSVLTIASLTLLARNMRQLNQWHSTWRGFY